jgi:hypothetical protein
MPVGGALAGKLDEQPSRPRNAAAGADVSLLREVVAVSHAAPALSAGGLTEGPGLRLHHLTPRGP